MSSGNMVHNLHTYAWSKHVAEPYDWAVRFETTAKELLSCGDFEPLVQYETLGRDAVLSIQHQIIIYHCSIIATKRTDERLLSHGGRQWWIGHDAHGSHRVVGQMEQYVWLWFRLAHHTSIGV